MNCCKLGTTCTAVFIFICNLPPCGFQKTLNLGFRLLEAKVIHPVFRFVYYRRAGGRETLRLGYCGGLHCRGPSEAGSEADQLEQAQRGALLPHCDPLPRLPKRRPQLRSPRGHHFRWIQHFFHRYSKSTLGRICSVSKLKS